jgi:hypothetical protein
VNVDLNLQYDSLNKILTQQLSKMGKIYFDAQKKRYVEFKEAKIIGSNSTEALVFKLSFKGRVGFFFQVQRLVVSNWEACIQSSQPNTNYG